MGNHRMFANIIIDNDIFLDMPLSAQALYFHLCLKADDEGFITNSKRIIRSINCTNEDFKLLVSQGFVIEFDTGIIVITHWNIHNSIRKDRKKVTICTAEKALVMLNENNVYVLLNDISDCCQPNDNQIATNCQPNDNQVTTNFQSVENKMSAQDKLSKDKLSKDNNIYNMSTSVDSRSVINYQSIINSFNSICLSLPKVQRLSDTRKKSLKNAIKILGNLSFEDLFTKVEQSDFLTGRSGGWNGCSFDWIIKPSNLTKIIEGNYDNKQAVAKTNDRNYEEEF